MTIITFPDDMFQGKENHPLCVFFEAFPSSPDPDCDYFGEFYCHMSCCQADAKVCKGDYILCPLAYGKSEIKKVEE